MSRLAAQVRDYLDGALSESEIDEMLTGLARQVLHAARPLPGAPALATPSGQPADAVAAGIVEEELDRVARLLDPAELERLYDQIALVLGGMPPPEPDTLGPLRRTESAPFLMRQAPAAELADDLGGGALFDMDRDEGVDALSITGEVPAAAPLALEESFGAMDFDERAKDAPAPPAPPPPPSEPPPPAKKMKAQSAESQLAKRELAPPAMRSMAAPPAAPPPPEPPAPRKPGSFAPLADAPESPAPRSAGFAGAMPPIPPAAGALPPIAASRPPPTPPASAPRIAARMRSTVSSPALPEASPKATGGFHPPVVREPSALVSTVVDLAVPSGLVLVVLRAIFLLATAGTPVGGTLAWLVATIAYAGRAERLRGDSEGPRSARGSALGALASALMFLLSLAK